MGVEAVVTVGGLRKLLVERGFAAALAESQPRRDAFASSGFAELDELLGGGFPRGEISECLGPISSGRASVALSLLAKATKHGELAAHIDASDSLDPHSAERAGIELKRLLWVRCEAGSKQPFLRKKARVDPAWTAANLVAAAGGFGVIVLDLCDAPQRRLQRFQRYPWAGLRNILKGSATALVVLSSEHVTSSFASRVVSLQARTAYWIGQAPRLLDGVRVEARLLHRRRGPQRLTREVCRVELAG